MKAQLLGCLLAFHAPNQTMFFIETSHIIAVRPDGHHLIAHMPKHVRSVIYTTAGNFGVVEHGDVVTKMIEDCHQENRSR